MTSYEVRDHPFCCYWRPVEPDAYDWLGLPKSKSEHAALARSQILAEASVVGRSDPIGWISYSRRREFYTLRRGRYWPPSYTYDFVVPSIDQLAGLGLLDHEKSPQGGRGWQSRFKASAELMELLNQAAIEVAFDPLEPIRLRDHRRSLVEYKETGQTRRCRRNIEEINEAIQSTPIALRNQIIRDGGALPLDSNFGAVSSQLHRVFNRCSFGLGGRFYGPWWQNIPSGSRSFISIDGVETVELDYPHLHPMLLYLEAGQRMNGDPYDLVGWPRKLVKVAFNTLVNADTRQAALRAIANEIGGEGAYAKARMLVEEIEARHRSIAQMFGTSAGLRLQRIDSDIAEGIMLRLARKTVVALPIHDSYIVRGLCFEKGELMEAMGEGLWRVVAQ